MVESNLFPLLGLDHTWSDQPREDGLVLGEKGRGSHVNLLCHLLPSSSPHFCLHPTVFLSNFGWDWKLLCDCQRWQIPCPTVLLSVFLSVCLFCVCLCVWSWGPQLRTELSCCKACCEDVDPLQLWLWGFSDRTKKMTKKILVVYKLICFHDFVFIKRAAKQLVLTESSTAVCSGQALQHDKTNQSHGGRQMEHALYCIVLKYFTWNKYPDNKSGNIYIVVITVCASS